MSYQQQSMKCDVDKKETEDKMYTETVCFQSVSFQFSLHFMKYGINYIVIRICRWHRYFRMYHRSFVFLNPTASARVSSFCGTLYSYCPCSAFSPITFYSRIKSLCRGKASLVSKFHCDWNMQENVALMLVKLMY